MTWNYSNTSVQTTLASGISAVDTSIVVASISGFPVSYPYTLVLDYGQANREVVNVTAGASTTLTVTRGQDGTSAATHSAGASVVHALVARDAREPQTHMAATTDVHGTGASSAVVGTTTTQTLTNKTISGSANTLTNISAANVNSGSFPKLDVAVTTDVPGLKVTDTAAGRTTPLLELVSSSVDKLTVDKSGNIVNAGGVTSSGALSGTTLTTTGAITSGGSIGVTGGVTASGAVTAASAVINSRNVLTELDTLNAKVPNFVKLTTTSSVTSTSLADTPLTLAVLANTNYKVSGWLYITASNAATPWLLSLNGPTGLNDSHWGMFSTLAFNAPQVSILATDNAISATIPSVSSFTILIKGYLSTGASAGNLTLRAAVTTNSGTNRFNGTSWLEAVKV